MYRVLIIVVAAVSIVIFADACREEQLTEQSVVTELDSLELKLVWLDYRLNSEYWQELTTGHSDSLGFFKRLYDEVVTDDHTYDLLRRGERLLTDKVDQRRANLIFSLLQTGRIEGQPELVALRRSIAGLMITCEGGDPGSPLVGCKPADESIMRTIALGDVVVTPDLAEKAGRLFRLRNQLARREGFNSYYALSMRSQGLDVDNHLALLFHLEEASRPSYQHYLDSIADQHGVASLSLRDLLLAVDISKPDEIWNRFPVDSEFVLLKQSMAAIGFNLDRQPIYFDDALSGDNADYICCVTVKPPDDARIFGYRPGRPAHSRELLYQLGRALYSTHVSADRPLFDAVRSPLWKEGISRVFADMTDEPAWLGEYAHASAAAIERFSSRRSGLETVQLRWMLTNLMFEYEAYRNPDRDLDKLYWEQVAKYMLVTPEDGPGYWALIPDFVVRPVHMHDDLYGEIIAAQTMAYLTDQYGGMTDRRDAYSFLVQNYLRFGSRYPWRDLLQRGTGEPLNPEYYLARLER